MNKTNKQTPKPSAPADKSARKPWFAATGGEVRRAFEQVEAHGARKESELERKLREGNFPPAAEGFEYYIGKGRQVKQRFILETLYVTPAQRDTILAALRCWQQFDKLTPELLDIATNCGQHQPLVNEEIDELCEAING